MADATQAMSFDSSAIKGKPGEGGSYERPLAERPMIDEIKIHNTFPRMGRIQPAHMGSKSEIPTKEGD